MKGLTPIEFAAIKVAGKRADKLRDRVDVGTHAVDVTVRVQGDLHVAGDQAAETTKAPKAETLLALVLAELGPKTRAKAFEGVAAACTAYREGGDEPEAPQTARDSAEDLYRLCQRAHLQKRRGNVTGELTCERVRRAA